MKRKIISILFALVLVLTLSLVTAVPAMAATLTVDTSVPVSTTNFHTIQDAVNAASPGDTIIVAAGTYNENVVVNKALTLEGAQAGVNARGRTDPESIINAQGVPIAVLINGADTIATFDGFTVDNYDTVGILAGAFRDTLQGVTLGDDPVEVHILNNIVEPPTVAPPHNNNIQVGDGTTGTIIGNEVSGALLEDPNWTGSGILVAGSSDVVVSNNYAHDCESGIVIVGYAEYRDAPAINNLIEDNLVEDSGTGISVQMNSTGTIISCNDVLNNDGGIAVMAIDYSWEHSTPSGTEIHCNNIVGNVNYGVKSGLWGSNTGNVPAEQVDATNNWWGDVSGPSGVASGSGDAVSDNVDFEPWSFTPDPCEPKSKGFWKNHPDSLDAVLDGGSVSLGDSCLVEDFAAAEPVFDNERAKCAEDMLAPQLLAAELNVLHLTHLGLYDGCEVVDQAIIDADLELADYDATGCNLGIKGKDKQPVLAIKDVLDSFNNGEMCGCECE